MTVLQAGLMLIKLNVCVWQKQNTEIKGALAFVAPKQLYLRFNLKLGEHVIDCSV